MFQNTDSQRKIRDDDYVSYMDWKESYVTHKKYSYSSKLELTASSIQANWLWDLDGMMEDPISRAKVMMPLIMHEIEIDKLSEEMEGELYGIQEDLENGLLDVFYDDELEELREDLLYCFSNIKK